MVGLRDLDIFEKLAYLANYGIGLALRHQDPE